ncbi:MAG: hypothetical protein LBU07_04895 [Coriobacteriales bacterium]|jgi:hypothetical protein|nr:hypothetical protein [Coriobacteriales bacterium]
MKAAWYFRVSAHRSLLISCIAIVLVRAYQFFTLDPESGIVNYHTITPIGLAVFVFTPLLVFPLSHIIDPFTKTSVVIRINDSIALVLRFCALAFLFSLAFALTLNLTASILVAVHNATTFEDTLVLAATVGCQTVFFLICALIFFCIFALTQKSYIAYIVLLCYVVWDYVVLYIPANLPSIGWGLTQFSIDSYDYAAVAANASALVCISIALILGNLIIARGSSFLGNPGV